MCFSKAYGFGVSVARPFNFRWGAFTDRTGGPALQGEIIVRLNGLDWGGNEK